MCVCTDLHELVVLFWIEVSLEVYVTESELLVAGQLLELLQLLHDLLPLQVLQLLQLLPLLFLFLKYSPVKSQILANKLKV